MEVERTGRFDDAFAHFRMKHGTFWRWVRPVFDGHSETNANARIEFRPIPAQPTVRDSVAFQAAFAGLLEQMRQYEHPLYDLRWADAKENFYGAMKHGLDAEFSYITANGEDTTDTGRIYSDLFEQAQAGLRQRGFSGETAARYLFPLRRRARTGTTPADWKRHLVYSRLADGDGLEGAIGGMQYTYFQNQRRTLLDGSFTDWFDLESPMKEVGPP
jgi:gamma-glutamyl:cysteine ligase YbdK (ATP-grasp superfamily)